MNLRKTFNKITNAGGNFIHKRSDTYHLSALKGEQADKKRQEIMARRDRRKLGL